MPKEAHPVLSVIIRRFRKKHEDRIRQSLTRLQEAARGQPGFLGEQNSVSHADSYCELVTVFAFDSRKSLERWEGSDLRNRLIADLDRHPHESSKHTQFDDLSVLLHPQSRVSKIEIVLVLIFWILALGAVLDHVAGFLLPQGMPPVMRNMLLVSVNVVLISYVLLPWSSRCITRLKTRFFNRDGMT